MNWHNPCTKPGVKTLLFSMVSDFSPREGYSIMKASGRKQVLILEPERDTAELFARALEARGDCKCYQASEADEALDLLKDIPFDLLLADLGKLLPADFSLLKRIRTLSPGLLIIVEGYLHQKEEIRRALALGAQGSIIKPVKVDAFRKKIDEFYLASVASPL